MTPSFRVGDRVKIPLGSKGVIGIVTEDRGPIGYHGRRLYQVRAAMDPLETTIFELPEEDIEHLGDVEGGEGELDRKKIQDYLVNGGLISILQSNVSGARSQPRVWLHPDSLGNVTHTFDGEIGGVGGAAVPFAAVHNYRVFTPKQDEVLSLLQSFGLDRRTAEKIIEQVGTAP